MTTAANIGDKIKIVDGVWSDDGETCLAGETGTIVQWVPSAKHGRLYFVDIDGWEDKPGLSLYPDDFTIIKEPV